MKSAVLVFPGINRERDMARALKLVSGHEAAMVWHADTALPERHRSRRGARRVFLWRLSALRRDRGALAGDGCGARICGRWRPRARRLQRFSDPLRSRPAAGRADAQCAAEIHLQGCASAGRALRHAVHARLQCRPGHSRAGRAWRGQLRGRRRDGEAARGRGAGALSLLLRRRRRRRRSPTSTAPRIRSPASSTSAATCSA